MNATMNEQYNFKKKYERFNYITKGFENFFINFIFFIYKCIFSIWAADEQNENGCSLRK